MGNRMRWTKSMMLAMCLLAILAACEVKPTQGTIDGAIISMEAVVVPEQNPEIILYQMFYWSEGVKAEAYITVPKKPGKYPLVIKAH
jgi:ABC-type Fe3+-hydroxamate transport system substrate-binding protein